MLTPSFWYGSRWVLTVGREKSGAAAGLREKGYIIQSGSQLRPPCHGFCGLGFDGNDRHRRNSSNLAVILGEIAREESHQGDWRACDGRRVDGSSLPRLCTFSRLTGRSISVPGAKRNTNPLRPASVNAARRWLRSDPSEICKTHSKNSGPLPMTMTIPSR